MSSRPSVVVAITIHRFLLAGLSLFLEVDAPTSKTTSLIPPAKFDDVFSLAWPTDELARLSDQLAKRFHERAPSLRAAAMAAIGVGTVCAGTLKGRCECRVASAIR